MMQKFYHNTLALIIAYLVVHTQHVLTAQLPSPEDDFEKTCAELPALTIDPPTMRYTLQDIESLLALPEEAQPLSPLMDDTLPILQPQSPIHSEVKVCKESKKRKKRTPKVKQQFICTICARCCKGAPSFMRHQYIHTGERPFSCKHCPQTFVQSHNYTRHLQHHISKSRPDLLPYFCTVCNNKLALRKFSIKWHLLTHHTIPLAKSNPYIGVHQQSKKELDRLARTLL